MTLQYNIAYPWLGVHVYDTIPMVVPNVINEYNRRYMETKKQRMNHQNFGDILRQDLLVSDIKDKPTAEDDTSLPDIPNILANVATVQMRLLLLLLLTTSTTTTFISLQL